MDNKKSNFFSKTFSFIEHFTSHTVVGGLSIGDSMLQYLIVGQKPKAISLRLPPGILKEGKVIDPRQFAAALTKFHEMIDPNHEGRDIPVIVTLPPGLVYTQSFQVPNVGKDKLSESGKLNLQMISPISEDKAYMSFQVVGETIDKFDLLGAIAERGYVDNIKQALLTAHFSAVILEFPGLALARALAYSGNTSDVSSMIFQVSSDGLNLSIVKGGNLYFDYFRSWTSIQGEERQISKELFESVVMQEVQKVLNFSLSRFRESLKRVYLIAPGFEEEIKSFVGTRFGVEIVPFSIPSWSVTPHWYGAFGSALRGAMSRSQDVFITLSNLSSSQLFREDQTINFIILWRNIIAGVMMVFLILFIGTAYFLSKEVGTAKDQLSIFTLTGEQKQLSDLEAQAANFNSVVSSIQSAKSSAQPWSVFLKRLLSLTSQYNVGIDRIDTSSLGTSITLFAHAPDNGTITSFRAGLSSQPDFSSVSLDIPSIRTLGDGSTGFTMTFTFNSALTP